MNSSRSETDPVNVNGMPTNPNQAGVIASIQLMATAIQLRSPLRSPPQCAAHTR